MALNDYTPTVWQNGEAGGTPLDADHLNKIESGISEVTQAVATQQAAQNTVVDISDQVTKLSSASNVTCKAFVVNGNELYVEVAWGLTSSDSDTFQAYEVRELFQLPDNVRPLVTDRRQFHIVKDMDVNLMLWVVNDGRIGVTSRASTSATLANAGSVVLHTPINTSLL